MGHYFKSRILVFFFFLAPLLVLRAQSFFFLCSVAVFHWKVPWEGSQGAARDIINSDTKWWVLPSWESQTKSTSIFSMNCWSSMSAALFAPSVCYVMFCFDTVFFSWIPTARPQLFSLAHSDCHFALEHSTLLSSNWLCPLRDNPVGSTALPASVTGSITSRCPQRRSGHHPKTVRTMMNFRNGATHVSSVLCIWRGSYQTLQELHKVCSFAFVNFWQFLQKQL